MAECGSCKKIIECGAAVGEAQFYSLVASLLCQGNFQLLCDPTTGLPVVLRLGQISATEPPTKAYNLDGTPYAGDPSLLVACVGEGGGGPGGGTFTLPTAAATTTQAVVGVTDASGPVLAANGARKGAWVRNISIGDVYIFMGAVATTALPTRLRPGESLVMGIAGTVIYTGIVTGINPDAGQTYNVEVVAW